MIDGQVEVRRAEQRFVTTTDWLVSRHSFSFGQHYDPDNVAFGPLLVCNEDVLAAGAGFDTHPHSGVDIVTWVLDGELTHRDSAGNSGVVRPGWVQRLSAGRGIEHSERNEGAAPVRYVQMWIASDEPDAEPTYAERDMGAELGTAGLVKVAAGPDPPGGSFGLRLGSRTAFQVARLPAGGGVELPTAGLLHLFLASGAVDVPGVGRLEVGDALRCHCAAGLRVQAVEAAEVLVWEMQVPLR